ncbi:GNAT family N-acetyltransferase [Lacrimispora brassicae]
MQNITFEVICNDDIQQCRELCNELMAFQKSKAAICPENFNSMNFDTRMKKSYESAHDSKVIVVKDNGVPVGYVFSTIDLVDTDAKDAFPAWAPADENMIGFYPDWVKLPQKIGCLSNLYLRDQYRSMGIGSKLFEMTMEWLESFTDVNVIFVYISNGNEDALDFYLNHGFTFSHDVFGGFIKAAYKYKS